MARASPTAVWDGRRRCWSCANWPRRYRRADPVARAGRRDTVHISLFGRGYTRMNADVWLPIRARPRSSASRRWAASSTTICYTNGVEQMFRREVVMPIRVLDPMVSAQIAAGEVVERPASVVKELVENALDAGARRVSVSVRGGGIEELVIQDDGGGIPADEIEVAFARHATSKLTIADDLWAIRTLGFRGEALPSIAAVAQVICISRTAGAPAGVELRIAGGETQAMSPRGAAVGTIFTIRNLFYNIPVRREFLKSPAAEATAIAGVVTQDALAYPQVAFTLIRDGKRIF